MSTSKVNHLYIVQALGPPFGYQAAVAVLGSRFGTEEAGATVSG
jgi:hypothetical protein